MADLHAMTVTDRQEIRRSYLYTICFVAAVGGFLFGYDLSIISPAAIFLQRQFHLGPAGLGFAVSSAVLGTMLGPFIGARLGDRIGRRRSLRWAAGLYIVGAIGTAVPANMAEFNTFRIVGGLSVGIASVISPMYIAEISPAPFRGRMVTMNQLAIVIGALCSIIVAYFLSFGAAWRWMFASECVPAIALLIGLASVPESPRWLMQANQIETARSVLIRISGMEAAERELKEIYESVNAETGSFQELFSPGIRTALAVAVGLAVFQQFTGISTLLVYAPFIFQNAGFPHASDAILQAVILNVWNLICTGGAFWLVDRVGRRPLLIVGTGVMAASLAAMGLLFQLHVSGIAWLIVLFVGVAAYSTSLAPLTWLIMSEMFPTRIRGRAMAIAAVSLWVAFFIVNQLYPAAVAFFERRYGSAAGLFEVFSVICLAALAFSWFFVPETKGRTLEEIAGSWARIL
jgi:SP family arabinose:H+ symporter-like MFS transporter